MPYITIEGGALTREQKSELIRKVTEVASEELPDENIGIGGRTIDLIK